MSIDQLYFTRCASDKGRERIDGFQVKACSEGITGETEKRVRFFSQVYRWPTSLDPLVRPGPMAPEDFFKFPVSLRYYRVPDGRFGLTRICIAPVQPGRAGNFFAHTVVFPPEALEPVSYNPFAVARSEIFQQQDESSQTELPELNDFGKLRVPEDKKCWNIATAMPYSEHLASLVDVLSTGQSDRPVIILPASLQDAWGLAEAVLLLLPGKFRIGIEFSIYEPDPYRVRGASLEQLSKVQKVITTSPREEGGKFQFRPEEYAGHYYIFNFAESKFSNFPTPSAYAQRVAADCCGGDSRRLLGIQQLLSTLDLASSPEEWDLAIPAAPLLSIDQEMSADEWRLASQALASSCHGHSQAKSALSLLWSKASVYSKSMPDTAFQEVASGCRALLEATSTHVEVPKRPPQTRSSSLRPYWVAAAMIILSILLSTFVTRTMTISTQEKKAMVLHEKLAALEKENNVLKDKLKISSISIDDSRVSQIKNALSLDEVKTITKEGSILLTFEFGLFEEGDFLTARARSVLDELEQRIISFQGNVLIEVEGHTDNVPVGENALYTDNYDLGLRRASSVINYMRKSPKLPADIFKVSSAGENNPLFPNDVVEERLKNRTVILRITPIP
ncbi:MAG: OmpA family protein [Proteobacteria bacterium]|nr:OmpA family protein [Pseudomonadota bacterium]